MSERQQGNDMAQQDGTRKVFGRRGLIAGAAAVAAAMVAAKTADSVKANGEVITVGSDISSITVETHLSGSTGQAVALLHLSQGGLGSALDAVSAGVTTGPGIYAYSSTSDGVHGQAASNNSTAAGLHGDAVPGGNAVIGECILASNSYGVWGKTDIGKAVVGQASGSGLGGLFMSGSSNGVQGSTTGTGVVAGVYGTSATAYGVIGSTTAPGYSGLTAITGTPGVAALAATSTNAGAYAAYFQGTTVVQGNFAVVGGNKSAAVPHTDGSHRLVYCVESPESWFEDVGKAKLVGGKADVKLDADFAAIVHSDDYHVFLTAYGNTNGLHVASQGARGFTVEEHNGGKGSLTFSWRGMAKRKDITGERLAKFDLPKINHPDPSNLPKPRPPTPPPTQR